MLRSLLQWMYSEIQAWRHAYDTMNDEEINPASPPAMPPPLPNPDTLLPWMNIVGHENNHHNVRVIADQEGLTYEQKEIYAACIKQESDFYPLATHVNTDGTEDFGLCQFNNGKNRHGTPFWIGSEATFPDSGYVLSHPEQCARVMARYFKTTGNLNPWASFSTGAYKKYLGEV